MTGYTSDPPVIKKHASQDYPSSIATFVFGNVYFCLLFFSLQTREDMENCKPEKRLFLA